MKNMNVSENTRYREAAEYATTVEAARNAVGVVTPADCLAYELRQYTAAYSSQVHTREYAYENEPVHLSPDHPDYTRVLSERRNEGERQLNRIYELHEQELSDEWADASSNNPPDGRLLLAHLLKESAHRLLDAYADYLMQVAEGRVLPEKAGFSIYVGKFAIPDETFASRLSRMKARIKERKVRYGFYYCAGRYAKLDNTLIAAGAGASELAHFNRLLAAFHEAEQSSISSGPTLSEVMLDKFSLRQVALLHVYKGLVIPKAADELARQYGHQSGAKLYAHYLTVSQRAGRIGEEITGQKLSPMLNDIAAVIPMLNGAELQQAQSELQTLRARK